ncbi:MAG: hypothetical protein ABIK07_18115 [Planctomycetota bacterium]
MADNELPRGRISSGIQPKTLIDRTIQFVYAQLPHWRDDPDRSTVESEERLNLQLCKYMNVIARHEFPMVYFNSEEHQGRHHKVDISATPDKVIEIHTNRYTKYDSFLVLEGKRLPTPGSGRTREYVTGGESRSGGIQRFRLGLHGNLLETAAMIGYIQSDTAKTWHTRVNNWVDEESVFATDTTCSWSASDGLSTLNVNKGTRTAFCSSSHQRMAGVTNQISLHHLWVEMKTDSKNI